jgi:hypothetical protein
VTRHKTDNKPAEQGKRGRQPTLKQSKRQAKIDEKTNNEASQTKTEKSAASATRLVRPLTNVGASTSREHTLNAKSEFEALKTKTFQTEVRWQANLKNRRFKQETRCKVAMW